MQTQMTGIICLEHSDEEYDGEAGLTEKSAAFC